MSFQQKTFFTKINCIVIVITLLFISATPSFGEDEKRESSVFGIVLGAGLIAGGSIFSIYNYYRAKEQYSLYKKSAFTDNTTELRSEVRRHDLQCVLGGIAAALGAVSIVVSF